MQNYKKKKYHKNLLSVRSVFLPKKSAPKGFRRAQGKEEEREEREGGEGREEGREEGGEGRVRGRVT